MSSIGVEQCLSPKDAKWYIQSPKIYHQGIYLGRNLGITETVDPVPNFLKYGVGFMVLRELGIMTELEFAKGAAIALLLLAPRFTKKYIFDRRRENLMDNYMDKS